MSMTETSVATGVEELINPANGTISDRQIVKVYNNGPDVVRWQYANEWYEIPGTQDPLGRTNMTVIPYHMMVAYCGDPRAFDVPNDPRRKYRTDEYQRLCVLYGVYDGTGEGQFPQVTVATINDTPVVTVLDDPEGKSVSEKGIAANRVEQQQNLIEEMAKQLQAQSAILDQLLKQQGETPGNRQTLTPEELADIKVADGPELTPEPINDETPLDPDFADAIGAALLEKDSDGGSDDGPATSGSGKFVG